MKCGACGTSGIGIYIDRVPGANAQVGWCSVCGSYNRAPSRGDLVFRRPALYDVRDDVSRMMVEFLKLTAAGAIRPDDLMARIVDALTAEMTTTPDWFWTWEKPAVEGWFLYRTRRQG